MSTIVNNPGPGNDQGSSAIGWIIAIIAIVILIFLGFTLFGAPRDTTNVNTGTPQENNQPAANDAAAGNTNPPTTNIFNTTVNATSTTINSTTTSDD